MRRPLPAAGAAARLALALLLAAAARAGAQGTGSVVGTMVARELGVPLPYGIVSVPALGVERFADASGRFVLRDLPAGPLTLRVRRLGYAPREVALTVRAGAADTVRVELTRLAVRLAAVRVTAPGRCDRPGPPSAAVDSALAAAFGQLQLNAQQYRLLAEAYPFAYLMEEMEAIEERDGNVRLGRADTLRISSAARWRYRPGRVVGPDDEPGVRTRELRFHIPTLVDFADSAFTRTHCFSGAGLEEVDGATLFRFDVRAAARLRTPDVDGAVWLDPETYQVRRTVLRLTNAARVRGLVALEVTTLFGEVLPSVPVVTSVAALQRLAPRLGSRETGVRTDQRIFAFEFLGARPGEAPPP